MCKNNFSFRQAVVTNVFTTGSQKNDENAYGRPAKSTFAVPTATHQNFTIHVDTNSVVAKAQGTGLTNFGLQEPDLDPAVTSLSRAPLTNLFLNEGTVRLAIYFLYLLAFL